MAVAETIVNFCLVPEVPFTLARFLSALQQRRSHAVIVVAEGVGRYLMAESQERYSRPSAPEPDSAVALAQVRKPGTDNQTDRHGSDHQHGLTGERQGYRGERRIGRHSGG